MNLKFLSLNDEFEIHTFINLKMLDIKIAARNRKLSEIGIRIIIAGDAT